MLDEQTIWLPPRTTAFTAVCDACLANQEALDGFVGVTVVGSLRLEKDSGWATCRRGHRIRVQRVERALADVIR